MVPFESLGAASYSHFIVTMAVPCIISETERDSSRKSRFFHTPCFRRPVRRPRRNIATPFGTKKNRTGGYQMVKKL